MVDVMLANCLDRYRNWNRVVAGLMRSQCNLMRSQCKLGWDVLGAMWSNPMSRVSQPVAASPESEGLERRAAERMRKGFAPPREVYDVQNRGRIDWAEAPEWARPADPEMFEGCGHEG